MKLHAASQTLWAHILIEQSRKVSFLHLSQQEGIQNLDCFKFDAPQGTGFLCNWSRHSCFVIFLPISQDVQLVPCARVERRGMCVQMRASGRTRRAASLRRAPLLPVEVWKKIADHMTTAEWAQISHTCRTMSQLQPRRISVVSHNMLGHLRWAMKHCSEAEYLEISVSDIACTELADIMKAGSKKLKHVQSLALDFTPDDDDNDDDFDDARRCRGFDEGDLPWLAQFLAQVSRLKVLRLEAVRIDVTMLQAQAQLKHLCLGFRLPFPTEACHTLQNLHSLETPRLSVQYESEYGHEPMVQIPGLDLNGCCSLRELHIRMLEPDMLSVRFGCSVSVAYDIATINRAKWHAGSALYNTCALYSNRYRHEYDVDLAYTADDENLGWLLRSTYPHLTTMELDYPRLCSVEEPLVINESFRSLRELTVTSIVVCLEIKTPLRLDTLILSAEENMNISVTDVTALAAGLKRLHLKWQSCCSTTYRLATSLTTPGDWCERFEVPRFTVVAYPLARGPS